MTIREHLRAIGEQLVIRAAERLLPGRRVVRGYVVKDSKVEVIIDAPVGVQVQKAVRAAILEMLRDSPQC